ncbi:MAG: hypothetical protein LQ346_001649 [Caloplaca aetnensis]|nr:MAG: hypothetical protein LQ346_001649 [Caloplaca aetnensis]
MLEQELARQRVDTRSIKRPEIRKVVSKLRVLDAVVGRIVKHEDEDGDAGNVNPTTPQGTLNETAWITSYSHIEKVLLAILKRYKIEVEADYDDSGSHSSHLSVLSKFDELDNPLHEIFGYVGVKEVGHPVTQVPPVREAIDILREWRN